MNKEIAASFIFKVKNLKVPTDRRDVYDDATASYWINNSQRRIFLPTVL